MDKEKSKVDFQISGMSLESESELESELVNTEIFDSDGIVSTFNGVSFVHYLRPGLYQVRIHSGAQSKDSVIVVKKLNKQKIVLDAPKRFSSAPLSNVEGNHEYYSAPFLNEECTREPLSDAINTGNFLFIYIRMRDIEHAKAYSRKNNSAASLFLGLKLINNLGVLLTEFDDIEVKKDQTVGMAMFRAEISPGYYRLVYSDSNGRSEWMPIHIFSGPSRWDTCISIIWDERPLLSSASLFTPMSSMVDLYNRYSFETTDAIIQCLSSGRRMSGIQGSTIKRLLNAKFSNPMLGIMGLHLYFLRGDVNPNTVKIVLKNLNRLVSESPDVQALHYIAAELGIIKPRDVWHFKDIPMLRLGALAMRRAYLSDSMHAEPLPCHSEQLFLNFKANSPWAQTSFVVQQPIAPPVRFSSESMHFDVFPEPISSFNNSHEKLNFEMLREPSGRYKLTARRLSKAENNKQDISIPDWLMKVIISNKDGILKAKENGKLDGLLREMAEKNEVLLATVHKAVQALAKNSASL